MAINQEFPDAFFQLGLLYYDSNYEDYDIDKAIYYFEKAAKLDQLDAHNILGNIYSNGKHVKPDINKAIKYFKRVIDFDTYKISQLAMFNKDGSLTINTSNFRFKTFSVSYAQFNLGIIYYEGKLVTKDIKSAIHYFTLASYQNHSQAMVYLGKIYYYGESVLKDVKKAISYFELASLLNNSDACFILANLYSVGVNIEQDMIKAIDYFNRASINGNKSAYFPIGYFYHEGKYIKRDLEKMMKNYKEASSNNDQYAQNNLGIIYKNGFGDEIPKKIGVAIGYFNDASKKYNDLLSMYNLAHIYIYEDNTKDRLDEAIQLLVKSIKIGESIILLIIALIKKNDFDLEKIKQEQNIPSDLLSEIIKIIINHKFFNEEIYAEIYKTFKIIDYLYDFQHHRIPSIALIESKPIQLKEKIMKDISKDFYDGLGNI